MYAYTYDEETGGILLNTNLTEGKMSKEPRPVYAAELDILGFDKFWNYDKQNDVPYMWAEANVYFYRGRKVASLKGGDLYHAPQIVLEKDEQGNVVNPEPEGKKLQKIDLKAMVKANRDLLEVLEVATVKKIKDVYEKYREKLDCFYVAFSGGKDSIVLFDLVRKTLPSKAFLVVFANTEMEFTDTEEVIRKVRQDCETSEIIFVEAKSVFSPQESWSLFGPPSRFLRWCCTVHKGTPQVLELRKITKKNDFCGMSFVGVRKNESVARSTYEFESFGKKQRGQYSCNPLLDWESSEIWLYTYANNLVVNEAYKKGCSRVGCICCPMGGGRTAFTERVIDRSKKDLFLNQIKASNSRSSFSGDEYILNGGWNARKNGRFLSGNSDVYSETNKGSILTINVKSPKTNWQEWIKPLGELAKSGANTYSITFKQVIYQFEYLSNKVGYTIIFHSDSTIESKTFAKYLRLAFRKAAFCVGCGACQANCRNAYLTFDARKRSIEDNSVLNIVNLKISNRCTHCLNCFEIQDGCLAYESLHIPTGEGSSMEKTDGEAKTLNTFSNHAPKKEWIADFLVQPDFLENNSLGPVQKTKFRRFLKDAGLVDVKCQNKTNFALSGKRLDPLGKEDEETFFALIMINLVAHNPQIKWYVQTLKIGRPYTRKSIEEALRIEGQSDGSIASIIGALNRFEENQFGTIVKWGGWSKKTKGEESYFIRSRCAEYNSLVILYGLFVFAEQCGNDKNFTLSTLLDDEIERAGVSPSQIFGLTRDEIKSHVLGLAINYPEFIYASFTHDLEKIVLSDDKTSQDVLELFKPN